MNGSLALVLALISYGNNYIVNNQSSLILDFYNSTLIGYNSLVFYDNSNVIAKTPEEWFNYLKKDGCKKLRACYIHSNQIQSKDFQTAGAVGGGGNWIIEAVYNDHSNFWSYTMKLVDRNATDRRIWRTEFYVIKNKKSIGEPQQTIEGAKHELSTQLRQIEIFASENKSHDYAKVFDRAIDMLSDPAPSINYYKDFVVKEQLSLSAKQLLFSACEAYVFGGMGSWNDVYITDEQKYQLYQKLTEELFDQVNQSIITAINTSK